VAETATIIDLARNLGVSKMTVSRALRGTGRMADSTRHRILEAARQLQYMPNAAAKAINRGKFHNITLLLGTQISRSVLPAQTLDGIHDALDERGLTLSLVRMPDEKLIDEGALPNLLRERSSDGMIVDYTYDMPPKMLDLVRNHHLPTVWLNTEFDADTVRPDDLSAGEWAAQRLIDLGHKRIIYTDLFYCPESMHYSHADRLDGYLHAMTRAGLKPRVVDRRQPPRQDDNEVDLWTGLLSAPDRPTAVLAYGDTSLHHVMQAAYRLGLRIPQDLSVMTFSGERIYLGVELDTMLVPEAEMGRQAVRMLMEKIEDPERVLGARKLPFTFEPGESVAPPVSVTV
jgi:DNA-binding LacI/PurR family transcriptional regulator